MCNSGVLNELRDWGCDIDSALNRMLGDEDFLLGCIRDVNNDESIKQLGEALKEDNVKAAFFAAHNLKGITSNTGITPLLNIIVIIVESLRNGKTAGLKDIYEELCLKNTELSKILTK